MIHFIYVILETDAYFYSCYYDLVDQLYQTYDSDSTFSTFQEQVRFSIFWDSDQSKHSLIHSFSSNGIIRSKLERSLDISTKVSGFVNQCCQSSSKDELLVFCFYVHGNIWFLRHCKKIITLQSIMDKIQYRLDVMCLESCYSASLENCRVISRVADILVTSEHTHARCGVISSEWIDWMNQRLEQKTSPLTSVECGAVLAKSFLHRVNSFSFRDVDTLSLVSDISVIDLRSFSRLYSLSLQLHINRQPLDVYKRSKIEPKRSKHKLGYDLWSVVLSSPVLSETLKSQFAKVYATVVLFYGQSKWMQEKPRASRSHGLCWCPAPYDSDYGWMYKLISAFEDRERLTIY